MCVQHLYSIFVLHALPFFLPFLLRFRLSSNPPAPPPTRTLFLSLYLGRSDFLMLVYMIIEDLEEIRRWRRNNEEKKWRKILRSVFFLKICSYEYTCFVVPCFHFFFCHSASFASFFRSLSHKEAPVGLRARVC